ncbi:hypothetical protein F5Y12DRAFT_797809 [Xylaria sp. FL1777]|nr:hypothetical protein F5Y12DRAFT_797809 [Xylaria sp. FL1777]
MSTGVKHTRRGAGEGPLSGTGRGAMGAPTASAVIVRCCGTAVLRWCAAAAAASGLPGFVVTREGFALFAAGTERARNGREDAGKRRQQTKRRRLSVSEASQQSRCCGVAARSQPLATQSCDGDAIVLSDDPAYPGHGWHREARLSGTAMAVRGRWLYRRPGSPPD